MSNSYKFGSSKITMYNLIVIQCLFQDSPKRGRIPSAKIREGGGGAIHGVYVKGGAKHPLAP